MPEFNFHQSVSIRYGDLDPQQHVNNVRYLTFLENARLSYLRNLGLWDGTNFLGVGIILADTHIAYLEPILYTDDVQVSVRVSHIGNKSIHFDHKIEILNSGMIAARAETVNVAYNYANKESLRVPDSWREIISAFEGRDY